MPTLTGEELLLKAGYSAKAVKIYMNKVNVGSIDDPDVSLTHTGLPYGDMVKIYLKLGENDVIKRCKIRISWMRWNSMLWFSLNNADNRKTVGESWKITADDVLKELGGLPESHCAELVVQALHKAQAREDLYAEKVS